MHQARHLAGTGLLVITGLAAAPAAEATFLSFLTDDSLAGRVTFDGFLGNGDDTFLPGLNTFGAASQFADSLGNFGFLRGDMATQGLTMLGPQERHVFGSNEHTYIYMAGEWNSYGLNSFNNFFSQSLNTGTPSQITINEDQTYTTSFVLDDDAFGGRIRLTGSGEYLLAGQDASSLYAGDLLTHFDFVTPLLPDGWVGVAHEVQTYEVLDGAYAGTTGINTLTFYTFDDPPEPPPVPLGAPWQTSGTVAISADGSSIVLQGELAPGVPATALLADGNTEAVSRVTLAGTGDAALTLQGAGTALSLQAGLAIDTEGSGEVDVLDGAVLEAPVLWHDRDMSGRSSFELTVSGAGSRVDSAGPSPVGVNGILDLGFQRDAAALGHTTVSAGGRIDIRAAQDQSAGIYAYHAMIVEGTGSAVRIEGSQTSSLPTLQTGIGIEQGTSLSVLDGGEVAIIAAGSGLSGVVLGGFRPPAVGLDAACLLVDGPNSTLSAPLLAIGVSFQYDGDQARYLEGGSGAASVATVRNGGTVIADRIVVGTAGTLMGNGGTLIGAVENHGTIAPGESPGTLTIDGDFMQGADGVLVIEIGGAGPGEYDVLHVTGTATLAGTLKLELVDGFVPRAGDSFDFLTAGLFAGDFATYDLPSIGGQPVFTLSFGPDGLRATVVPLPGAAWLFASAALALAARRRTRSS